LEEKRKETCPTGLKRKNLFRPLDGKKRLRGETSSTPALPSSAGTRKLKEGGKFESKWKD